MKFENTQLNLLLSFALLLGLIEVWCFSHFLPKVEQHHQKQLEENARFALDVEINYFNRIINHRKNELQTLAAQPAILNAVMQLDKDDYELINVISNFKTAYKNALIEVQDLAGGSVYQKNEENISFDKNARWLEQLRAGSLESHLQLLDGDSGSLRFTLAIPIRYGDYVEGVLLAQVEEPLKSPGYHQSGRYQVTLEQENISRDLYPDTIESAYSISRLLDQYGITITYTVSNKTLKNFIGTIRNVSLIIILFFCGFILLQSIYLGRQKAHFNRKTSVDNNKSTQSTEKKLGSSVANTALPLLTLVFGFVFTYIAYTLVAESTQKNKQDSELTLAKNQALKLLDGLESNLTIFTALKAYYLSSKDVTRKEFSQYLKPLMKRHKGIQSLNWVPVVEHEQRATYEEQARYQGYDTFRFLEEFGDQFLTASKSPTYYPVYFVEPLQDNETSLGVDLGTMPSMLAALRKAEKSRQLVATEQVVFSQNIDKEVTHSAYTDFGTVVFSPIFKNPNAPLEQKGGEPILGYLMMTINLEDFVRSSLPNIDDNFSVSIFDATDNKIKEENGLLYSSNSNIIIDSHNEIYSKKITIADRTWLIKILRKQQTSIATDWGSVLILVMGSFISLIAAGYIMQLSQRRRYFENLVKTRTQEIEELSTAMENAVEGVSQLDESGFYTYVNEAYASTCGYTPEELLGQHWSVTIAFSDSDDMQVAYANMLKNGRASAEALGVKKDHSYFHKSVTMISRLSEDGIFSGHFCFMSDISTRKYAEEKLIQSNVELGRFAYMASHDLQKPLTKLSEYTDLLEKECSDNLNSSTRRYFDSIRENSQHMNLLLEDLLAYGHFDQNGDTFGVTDVELECTKVTASLKTLIRRSNATITANNLPTISANPNRIHQLLKHLICNAIKYSDPNREPIVKIDCVTQGENWLFSIADNGIGMQKENLDKIFVVFKRLNKKSETPGTGIGLAICQKIVASLGGLIWVESQPGKGTTFYFSIPCKPPNVDTLKREHSMISKMAS